MLQYIYINIFYKFSYIFIYINILIYFFPYEYIYSQKYILHLPKLTPKVHFAI